VGGRGAIVVETDPAKRDAALRAGALAVIDPNSIDAAKQVAIAAGGTIWAAIDFVGASSTAALALEGLVPVANSI
jgi:propanol-preferring alcohol dehydrogenase